MAYRGLVSRERIERAARIYRTNEQAAAALGITPTSFGRLCRRYEVLSPSDRRKRRKNRKLGHQGGGYAST